MKGAAHCIQLIEPPTVGLPKRVFPRSIKPDFDSSSDSASRSSFTTPRFLALNRTPTPLERPESPIPRPAPDAIPFTRNALRMTEQRSATTIHLEKTGSPTREVQPLRKFSQTLLPVDLLDDDTDGEGTTWTCEGGTTFTTKSACDSLSFLPVTSVSHSSACATAGDPISTFLAVGRSASKDDGTRAD